MRPGPFSRARFLTSTRRRATMLAVAALLFAPARSVIVGAVGLRLRGEERRRLEAE